MRPFIKTGVVIVMSLICPAVIHGSLVISTSPGASCPGGKAARKWRMDVAIALMCPGVPVTDWPIIRPWVSNRPQARSWLSRTIVLKAVRISASCCSLATESRRLQMISSVTGSIALSDIDKSYDNVRLLVHTRAAARSHNQSRLPLLDDRWAAKALTGSERIAIVHGRLTIAALFREVGHARVFDGALPRGIAPRQMKIGRRSRPAGDHAPVDHLERDIRSFSSIECLVDPLKSRSHLREVPLAKHAIRKRHRDFVPLPYVAHVRTILVRNLGIGKARLLEHRSTLASHLLQESIDEIPVEVIQPAVGATDKIECQRS